MSTDVAAPSSPEIHGGIASQRAYKACDVCRKRKSRCTVGSGATKCQRCLREGRACVFPEHRYKQKPRRARQSRETSNHSASIMHGNNNLTEHATAGPGNPCPSADGLAESVMRTVVLSGNDARDLLFSAVREDRETHLSAHGVRPNLSAPSLACTAEESPYVVPAVEFMTLPGAGGATRSRYIHDRLWAHIQHLLLRLVLGQEKLSKGKLRTLGSLEALLLLTEWHPRGLAFPPPMDGWDSALLHHSEQDGGRLPTTSAEQVRDRWAEDVVRPARRFDQMSWMLLGNAMTLACDMGVFNQSAVEQSTLSRWTAEHDQERAERLRGLIYI
ncbi:uncharacterized protein LTR77_000937 [Saxophila tyrrhenica]|uniref:Zn(2)-C6 fungal-type domain-containing protein n=1 Tax=Saxophila tyrrhenica TaxID=1690608 RepID=A0AAV9PSJ5_9PEZI|nr:hypothetical protein LTR77_000937 [Saxophila tyrrhenica]